MTQIFEKHFSNNRFMYLWWSQDGAPYHQLIAVREVLNEFFVNPVISLYSTQNSLFTLLI